MHTVTTNYMNFCVERIYSPKIPYVMQIYKKIKFYIYMSTSKLYPLKQGFLYDFQ